MVVGDDIAIVTERAAAHATARTYSSGGGIGVSVRCPASSARYLASGIWCLASGCWRLVFGV